MAGFSMTASGAAYVRIEPLFPLCWQFHPEFELPRVAHSEGPLKTGDGAMLGAHGIGVVSRQKKIPALLAGGAEMVARYRGDRLP